MTLSVADIIYTHLWAGGSDLFLALVYKVVNETYTVQGRDIVHLYNYTLAFDRTDGLTLLAK